MMVTYLHAINLVEVVKNEIKSEYAQPHYLRCFPTYCFDKLPNNCQVAPPKKNIINP